MIPSNEVAKIRNVLIVAEQGRQEIAYGAVYIYADGPNNVRQITLSIGFTQYGNLGPVVASYAERTGRFSANISKFVGRMREATLVNNAEFINLLKEAGADPVMQKVQEEMFDKFYLAPGIKWGTDQGFTLPLSFLVICDSYLHSGSILSTIRNRFPEKTPANGGDEKKWISQYTNARQDWLANHSNTILHATVYRTKYYKQLIANNDWELDGYSLIAMNGVKPLAIVA
jgi:chitosanase